VRLRDLDLDVSAGDQVVGERYDLAAVEGGAAGFGAKELEQVGAADCEIEGSEVAAARGDAGAFGKPVGVAALVEADVRLGWSRKQLADARAAGRARRTGRAVLVSSRTR
jgi:hypothetical protein